MLSHSTFVLLSVLAPALAFPTLSRGSLKRGARRAYGPVERRGAAPYSSQYPYTGAAIDGLPGSQIGGIQVPAPGDTAHEFQHPPVGAYRGPCPGLNTAANHGFLSRDGVTNFNELVAAQQNLYNTGYDLAVVLAVFGVGFDGDVLTEKLSIGGDATALTSSTERLSGDEGGLDSHVKFESDASLTRNDYYLANGDNYKFNGTLFKMMTDTAASTSSSVAPLFTFAAMAKYRAQRYAQSLAENGNFYFGPPALLIYGAASFLYELMPSGTHLYTPDLATISSFFGAQPAAPGSPGNATGGYDSVPERIPPNFVNRVLPYTLLDVATQILDMYLAAPGPFGANAGVGNFEPLSLPTGSISGNSTAPDVLCALYNLISEQIPGEASLPVEVTEWMVGKLDPIFANFGCPSVSG